MAANWYGLGLRKVLDGTIDLTNDTIKVLLASSTYVPNQDTHEFVSDVTNQITNADYANALTLSNKAFSYDAGTNEARFDNTNDADTTWVSATITNARQAILFKQGTIQGDSPVIAYYDFGSDKSSSGADFKLEVAATGLLKLTAL